MPHGSRLITIAALVALGLVWSPARADVTDEQVDATIHKGCEWLLSQAQPDGKFTSDGIWHWYLPPLEDVLPVPRGTEAIIMCALAHAGADMNDDRVCKGFEYLIHGEPKHTYMASCRVIALARLLPRLRREQADLARKVMRQDVAWLLETQQKATDPDPGMWAYPTAKLFRADFSNTQMAILALQEFELTGGELPSEPFARALKPYLELQNADGGWNYGHISHRATPSYGSMTAAGVASLFIIRDKLFGTAGCPCRGGRSGKRPEKIDQSIHRGITWLGGQFVARSNPPKNRFGPYYWLYAVQRVAMASGVKYLGTHDWYREGAQFVIRSQRPDGCWDARANYVQDNCFAIMFLAKGRSLILMNKLQYDGPWDIHPRDAANLCKFVGAAKEQSIAWQAINLDVPVEEWHDAPILYVTAETQIKLTDDQKKKLRRFTDTGGTLLVEATCGNTQAAAWWKSLCREIWPEWELKRLDKKHPLWTCDLQIKGRQPLLHGIHDGVRTFLFLSTSDISCAWQTFAVTRQKNLFELGCNLHAYATDRGALRTRLAGPLIRPGRGIEGQSPQAGGNAALKLGHLKHGGDYYVGRNYGGLAMLAEFLKERASLNADVAGDVDLGGEAPLKGYDALWLNGRTGLSLTDTATGRLKAYVAGGGFLIAESIMGDTRFTADFEKLAADLGLKVVPLATDHELLTGAMAKATGYNVSAGVRFSQALRLKRVKQEFAALNGLYLGDRLVGVHSPYDILYSLTGCPAYGILGYAADDAMAVGANLLLGASVH